MTQREVNLEKWYALRDLNTGDKVKLSDGSIAEFVRLKQKNFIGTINGQSYNCPVNMFVEVVEKVNIDEKLNTIAELKKGEHFYINKNGNAMLFIFEKIENGRIIGINPISKGLTTIDKTLYASKVSDI